MTELLRERTDPTPAGRRRQAHEAADTRHAVEREFH
jgi:hypothetical protein